MDSEMYGPPLPPGFKRESSDDSSNEASEHQDANDGKKNVIGPQCPPSFLKTQSSSDDLNSSECDKSNCEDPDLGVVGPELPQEFTKSESEGSESDYEASYGPVPAADRIEEDVNDIVATVEKRAKDMKRKLEGSDVPVKKVEREEWMTVPNTSSRNQLGAISRCLSNDATKSKSSKKNRKHYKSSKEEQKLSKELEKYNKSKRSESLLEMHRKNKKKKQKDNPSKPAERKPFNRDDDMSLRLMNKDQVKSVIDKAKYLDSRFSRGQTKYL